MVGLFFGWRRCGGEEEDFGGGGALGADGFGGDEADVAGVDGAWEVDGLGDGVVADVIEVARGEFDPAGAILADFDAVGFDESVWVAVLAGEVGECA